MTKTNESNADQEVVQENSSSSLGSSEKSTVGKADKVETSPKKTGGRKKPAKEPKAVKTGLLWLFVLLTLAASGAAGYGVYYLWQQDEVSAVATVKQSDLLSQSQTAIVDLRGDLGDFRDVTKVDLAAQMSEVKDTRASIGLLEKSIAKQARHIKELSSSNRDEWLLAEVEYLLRIANQRILMSKDSAGALAMLDTSDKILQEIDDLSLHQVRRAIMADMTSLRNLDAVDLDGMYLQLASLSEQLDGLVLYDIPEFGLPSVETVVVDEAQENGWQQKLGQVAGSVGATFKKAFIIRRDGESVEAMLPPQDELYLRQNLRLMLEQAQLALIARNPVVFQESLKKAQRWLAQYFMTEKDGTQAALQTVSRLSTIDVDPPLPDISGSFRALKKYQQAVANQRPGLPATPSEEVGTQMEGPETNSVPLAKTAPLTEADVVDEVVPEASGAATTVVGE